MGSYYPLPPASATTPMLMICVRLNMSAVLCAGHTPAVIIVVLARGLAVCTHRITVTASGALLHHRNHHCHHCHY